VVIYKLFSNKSQQFEQSLLCTTMETIIAKNKETKKYENPFDDFFYRELDVIHSLTLKVINFFFFINLKLISCLCTECVFRNT